jgi:hypothetical protein
MSKLERLARRLVMLFALAAGCGTASEGNETPTPTPTPDVYQATPAELNAAVKEDLARLRSLSVVSVGGLVLSQEAQAASCYSAPCELSDSDPVIADYRRQQPRLRRLLDAAQAAIGARELPEVTPAQTQADLAALESLRIVTLQGLVTVAPATQANCYGLPCPEDIARADAENRRRAGAAHVLAAEVAARPF